MAQAIKDDRCGHCAQNAAAILRAYWRESLETGGQVTNPMGGPPQPDPVWNNIETKLANGPVFIDPVGYIQFNGTSLGGTIPRVTLDPNSSFPAAFRWCCLLDDVNFNPNGTPVILGGNEIARQGWYSWAWMVRWLRPNDPNPRARALEYSVVVYHNRPMTQSATLQPVGETPYGAMFDPANRIVTVQGSVPVRKGSWILDASPGQGYFYRVESITSQGGSTVIGVQSPFRGGTGGYQQYGGTVVFMDSVAEVFERSTLE
jgi:hypothetical protein